MSAQLGNEPNIVLKNKMDLCTFQTVASIFHFFAKPSSIIKCFVYLGWETAETIPSKFILDFRDPD